MTVSLTTALPESRSGSGLARVVTTPAVPLVEP